MAENKGFIKKIVRERGFGFITREGVVKDLYFHASGLQKGLMWDSINENDNVEWDGIEPTEKGEQAYGVRVV